MLSTCLLLLPIPASAQLRPLDPLPWRLFEPSTSVTSRIGFGMFREQRASLAGTQGTLYELGNFALGLRSGRIGMEFSGTMVRRFRDHLVLRPPSLGAWEPPPDGIRRDAGDFRIETMVRLVGDPERHALAYRFGTRLPTTSDEPGLDRDRTDIYSIVAGRTRLGALTLAVESGLGVHGTRMPGYDQSDVWVYAVALEYVVGAVTAAGSLVGHRAGHDWIAGNEELQEVRLGVRAGGRRWVDVSYVRGLATYSPANGFLVSGGLTFE